MKGQHRGKHPRLSVVRVEDVPIKEVSGVCLRRDAGGVMALVVIGDRAATAAWVILPTDDQGPLNWQVADLTGLPDAQLPAQDPQHRTVEGSGPPTARSRCSRRRAGSSHEGDHRCLA